MAKDDKKKTAKDVKDEIISLQSSTRPMEPEIIPVETIDERGEEEPSEIPSPEEPKKELKKEEQKKEEGKKEEKLVEKLILGKFKTEEDLIKAYQEAEKKISQQGEEISLTKKEVELIRQFSQQPTQPQVAPGQTDPLAEIRPYFPGYDDNTIMAHMGLNNLLINIALKRQREQLDKDLQPLYDVKFERDTERQKKQVEDKYKNLYNRYESELNEKLDKLPPSLRAKDGGVETVFLTILGEHTSDLTEEAKQNAQKEIQSVEAKKEDTFVEGEGKSSVPTPPLNFGKMSAAQLKEAINKRK